MNVIVRVAYIYVYREIRQDQGHNKQRMMFMWFNFPDAIKIRSLWQLYGKVSNMSKKIRVRRIKFIKADSGQTVRDVQLHRSGFHTVPFYSYQYFTPSSFYFLPFLHYRIKSPQPHFHTLDVRLQMSQITIIQWKSECRPTE